MVFSPFRATPQLIVTHYYRSRRAKVINRGGFRKRLRQKITVNHDPHHCPAEPIHGRHRHVRSATGSGHWSLDSVACLLDLVTYSSDLTISCRRREVAGMPPADGSAMSELDPPTLEKGTGRWKRGHLVVATVEAAPTPTLPAPWPSRSLRERGREGAVSHGEQ